MIKTNLVAGLLICSMVAQAQNAPTQPTAPPTTPNPIAKAPESKKVKLSDEGHDHFMINFTIDNVINNSPDSFFKSSTFNPNLGFYFLYDLPIGKTGFSVAPGLGLTFSKVNLDESVITTNTQGTSFINYKKDLDFASIANFNYDGSSFYSSWAEVPFELRYISKPINGRSRIKVAAGIRAGLNMTSNRKVNVYVKDRQEEETFKRGPINDFASFRYGATFRIGYGAINLFGYYGLNQMIKENRNYNKLDLRQYSIGVSITGM
jgi:hypothetical protein